MTSLAVRLTLLVASALATVQSRRAADNGLIGVSVPNVKGPWYTPELYGITDEAKKLGYQVIIQDSGGYGNVDKQVSQMSSLIVQKAKAIIVDPADPTAFNGVVREAQSAGAFILGAGVTVVATTFRSTPPPRPIIATSAMNWRKAPRSFCPMAARQDCSPVRLARFGRQSG